MLSRFIQIVFSFLIIAIIALMLLLLLYGVIRLLRLAERWVMRVIHTLLIVESILSIVLLLQAQQAERIQTLAQESELLGFASCMLVVYSFSMWGSHTLYLLTKKRVSRVNTMFRNMLLFFRRHHSAFGWLVLITAIGHAVILLPAYTHYSLRAFLSGTLALVLLCTLVLLGISIERAIKQKRLSAKARMLHIATAATFFVILLLHLSIQ